MQIQKESSLKSLKHLLAMLLAVLGGAQLPSHSLEGIDIVGNLGDD